MALAKTKYKYFPEIAFFNFVLTKFVEKVMEREFFMQSHLVQFAARIYNLQQEIFRDTMEQIQERTSQSRRISRGQGSVKCDDSNIAYRSHVTKGLIQKRLHETFENTHAGEDSMTQKVLYRKGLQDWKKLIGQVMFCYHEDGSKKLNACNQLFLCMVYF